MRSSRPSTTSCVVSGRNAADPLAQSLDRDGAHLRDLHPRLLGQRRIVQLQRQREAGTLSAAGERHRDHRFRARVEEIVAQYQDGTKAGLLAPAKGIEVASDDVASQYAGHASASIPSSASFFSSVRLSFIKFPREPCSFLPFRKQGHRELERLAAVRILAFADPSVETRRRSTVPA